MMYMNEMKINKWNCYQSGCCQHFSLLENTGTSKMPEYVTEGYRQWKWIIQHHLIPNYFFSSSISCRELPSSHFNNKRIISFCFQCLSNWFNSTQFNQEDSLHWMWLIWKSKKRKIFDFFSSSNEWENHPSSHFIRTLLDECYDIFSNESKWTSWLETIKFDWQVKSRQTSLWPNEEMKTRK